MGLGNFKKRGGREVGVELRGIKVINEDEDYQNTLYEIL